MANIDIQPKPDSELNGTVEHSQSGQPNNADSTATALPTSDDNLGPVGVSGTSSDTEPTGTKALLPAATDAHPTVNGTRASLVQLGSASNSLVSSAQPQPKRFSASNINKKFLEKTSSTTGTTTTTATSSTNKSSNTTARPTAQSNTSHPRLVAAKLTANPSTSTGPGWSRPSSAAPSTTASSAGTPNGIGPPNGIAPPARGSGAPASPQLPHAGKIIQPQPRSLGLASVVQKDSGKAVGSKPVWGNVKSNSGAATTDTRAHDFPTAAEVAQSVTTAMKGKVALEAKEALAAAASKQARMEEADTFRGVHLNPNAHHWDEMEEEDDDFLAGVIEFGDGRQYKIESTEQIAPPQPPLSPLQSLSRTSSRSRSNLDEIQTLPSSGPVSKEERFADDIDRSWPRSRNSPAMSSRDFTGSQVPPAPPTTTVPISPATTSPSESARVLFNERSNRLEPYSNNNRPSTFHNKRSGHPADHSPTEPRGGRDHPPGANNVQLLQKGSAPANDQSRGRPFGGRRESNPPPPTPHSAGPNGPPGRDFDRGRRPNNAMGPPPVPPHRAGRDNFRQPPPHLSTGPLNNMGPPPPRSSSNDTRHFGPQSAGGLSSSSNNQPRNPSQSPALSHASAVAASPVLEKAIAPGVDIDEIRKDVMQSAAARAKQRRQQEEEQREKEKERARRKAAELQEKMEKEKELDKAKEDSNKQVERPREEEVLAILTDAISGIAKETPEPIAASKPLLRRPPSLKSLNVHPTDLPVGPGASRRLSSASVGQPMPSALPSAAADSWRSKATPLPPVATPRHSARPSVSFVPPPLSALEQSLAEEPEADMEVVDFSDMGKLVGEEAESQAPVPEPPVTLPSRASRPTASDFLNDDADTPMHAPVEPEQKAWRPRTVPTSLSISQADSAHHHSREVISTASAKESDQSGIQTVIVPPSQSTAPKTPRSQAFYKEAAMSALNDAMSRIRGALDGMQHGEKDGAHPTLPEQEAPRPTQPPLSHSKSLPPKDRWVPPALRPRGGSFTSTVPPLPPTAWTTPIVKLPQESTPMEPVNKKLIQILTKPMAFRWDILTFEPPVEGMNKRDLSVNEVLFRRQASKTRYKFKVLLPRPSHPRPPPPRVSIPPAPKPGLNVGAFGKPTSADGASSWRKPAPSPLASAEAAPASESAAESAVSSPTSTSKAELTSSMQIRSRSQPKMPAGSAVAFYRDSKVVEVDSDPRPLVSFIVTSELDESHQSSSALQPGQQPDITLSSPAPTRPSDNTAKQSLINGIKPSRSSEYGIPSLSPSSSKSEGKTTDDSTDRVPITPPSHHPSGWARSSLSLSGKESTSRVPDPEHLKALWSQTSDKANPINSLEGIGDDLTGLPFTLQDVKSEDGETPPPSLPSAPSRMSLHDVTRAFQQVPASSASAPLRPTISPPSTTAPVARPPSYGYTVPPNQPMRPAYAPYPSPMMAHAPSPIMYSHPMPSPVPSRMQVNGHGQMYAPQVWMSPMQTPPGMMRPMPSPYPMPYPSPTGQPMYVSQPPPNMQNGTPQQQNNQNRPRGMSSAMMSPVMPHAVAVPHPMYAGSPVLMHAPPAHTPGRPPGRNDTHPSMQNPQQPQYPAASPLPPNPYAPMQPTQYGRQPW